MEQQHFGHLISQARTVESRAELSNCLAELSKELGASHYWFALHRPLTLTRHEVLSLHNLPFEWGASLTQTKTSECPVAQYASDHTLVTPLLPLLKANFQSAIRNEKLAAMVSPVHGVGLSYGSLTLFFNHSEDAKRFAYEVDNLAALFAVYHQQANRILSDEAEYPKLSPREKECLKWVSEGKTTWEVAKILNIAERTASFHLNNVLAKTQSENRNQAITKLLLNGSIF
ncbi:helix-turn-helix transcriptional regulator [Gallaecimonas mangrovi]|uniref:helix-turn-helix transcriptional regulator n=1 Tax=Gallaecimonas mangrovi TaxID=2291597 RepID=UPI000E203D09|nr:helix-turn-helix transcriptional regulator [Gallaecimonas mangrovi]